MKISWLQEQYMTKKVTFEDAQMFLNKNHLVKRICFEDILWTRYFWFDDENNLVAQASYDYRVDDGFSVFVLGSCFTKKEAQVLLRCYKTMKTEEYR